MRTVINRHFDSSLICDWMIKVPCLYRHFSLVDHVDMWGTPAVRFCTQKLKNEQPGSLKSWSSQIPRPPLVSKLMEKLQFINPAA